MKLATIALATMLVCGGASAMRVEDVPVKCTAPDGKVTYQRGSCPPGNKIDVVRADASTSSPEGSWTFERSTDSMTNTGRCTAISPRFSIPAKREYIQAQVFVLYLKSGGPFVAVLNQSSGAVFHHNIRDTGIKVGEAGMIPFGSRPTQSTLVLPPGTDGPVIESMLRYPTAKVRIRMWPWDETYDSLPISLSGFKQANALAKQCSARL